MSEKKEEFHTIATLHGSFKTKFLTETYKRRKAWKPLDPREVKSHIPGTVLEYKVAVGDKVSVGDVIFIFKAMKMDSIVKSEVEGVVKSLCVEVGVNVPKGKLLLEFV